MKYKWTKKVKDSPGAEAKAKASLSRSKVEVDADDDEVLKQMGLNEERRKRQEWGAQLLEDEDQVDEEFEKLLEQGFNLWSAMWSVENTTTAAGAQGDVDGTNADISKSKKLINYDPKTNLKDGLKNTYEYLKNN